MIIRDWHLWFAWRPVKIGDHWFWLRYIWRRETAAGAKFDRIERDYSLFYPGGF